MQKKAMILWLALWSLTMPIIHARNGIAAKDFDFGRTIFIGIIYLIPAIILAFVSWFILKFIVKSIFNKTEVTPAISLFTWLVIFLLLFLIPLFG